MGSDSAIDYVTQEVCLISLALDILSEEEKREGGREGGEEMPS